MASTERIGYTSRRTASTSYDDDDDADEERGSTIHRLTAIDELSAGGGVDAFASAAGGGRNASNLWERFDDHIRRIATADPKEQYHKKKSTDKASETYMAALREFYYEDSDEESDFSDSEDEELKVVVAAAANNSNDAFKDEQVGLPRNTPVETTSRRNRKGGSDGELTWENSEKNSSPLRDNANTYWGHHQSKQQQQQHHHQTDENAVKRMVLYEKYLERDNAWADGLTKCGKEILMEIQKRKKRPKRFVVFSTSMDNSRSSEMKSASRSKRSISYHL